MDRAVVVLDPAVGVSAAAMAAAWSHDEQARVVGTPSVEAAPSGQFFTGIVELVVIPLLVGVAGDALKMLVRRVLHRAHQSAQAEPNVAGEAADLTDGADVLVEVVETAPGVRTVVVRVAGGVR